MTTPEAAVAKAYEIQHEVTRAWPGYDAPVSRIWCNNSLTEAGQCGVSGAQHCIATVGTIWEEIGLTPREDFPFPIWYCPDVHRESDEGGFTVDTPAPGDGITIDWEGDGTDDHGEIVIDADNWPTSVTTMGFNTDETGEGVIHERPASLIRCIIRPRWRTFGTARAVPPPPKHFALLGGDMILMVPLTDGSGHNYFDLIGGVLLWRGNDGVKNNTGPVVEFDSDESFKSWYRRYCELMRSNSLTGAQL
jgi:hypothetical protein